jgi:hypothetical protein
MQPLIILQCPQYYIHIFKIAYTTIWLMLIGTANFQFVIVLYPKIIRIFVLYANLIHCPLKNRFNLLGGNYFRLLHNITQISP